MGRVAYSRHYNIGFFGLERLHPFDSRKYGRAWKCLRQHFGRALDEMHLPVRNQVTREQLLLVHDEDYLNRLKSPAYVAQALELPPVALLPHFIIDRCVLRPMRYATQGTILAAEAALRHDFAVNLSGGYHHAKPRDGEGFCIYADIAIAIHSLRRNGQLDEAARVACIDLDAHQGNGVAHCFHSDNRVFLFDMFNPGIYPCFDVSAKERVDCKVGANKNTTEREYLADLEAKLPPFLDNIGGQTPIGLAIYNAGTDVFVDDPLGDMNLSAKGILRRDLFVAEQLRERSIPCVMLLSGGYTKFSYRLVADSVIQLLEACG